MARCESLEAFVCVYAMGRPRAEQRLDRLWRITGANIRLQQAAYRAVRKLEWGDRVEL